MVHLGEVIPEVVLDAYVGKEVQKVSLSDYRGKWLVLIFYPADFTFICPTELSELADRYEEFRALGAEVASASTDTVWAHAAWSEMSDSIGKIEYPMLADPSGALCRSFGTYNEQAGLSCRGTFIIDPDGVLKAYELHDNSIGRSAEEILRKLSAAVYVHGAEGEVCPASWRPGEKTLSPSLDLIGKL